MLQELEQQRAAEIELQKRKEVHSRFGWQCYTTVKIGAVFGFFLTDYSLTDMIRQKTEFSFTLINCGSWQMNIFCDKLYFIYYLKRKKNRLYNNMLIFGKKNQRNIVENVMFICQLLKSLR